MSLEDQQGRGDPVTECRYLLARAREADIPLRAMGGVAVALRCPTAGSPPLARRYEDVDFATTSGRTAAIEALFKEAGYSFDPEFNAINGHRRLMFWDSQAGRKVDVFVDQIEMCHALDVRDRVGLDEETLPLADLLLLKLQVVETTQKDYLDLMALLADHPIEPEEIDGSYVADVLARDWGWWRTVTGSLDRLMEHMKTLKDFPSSDAVAARVTALTEQIAAKPKSRRWKVRARVGERVSWHNLPEEVT
jgi:hypothetical protein